MPSFTQVEDLKQQDEATRPTAFDDFAAGTDRKYIMIRCWGARRLPRSPYDPQVAVSTVVHKSRYSTRYVLAVAYALLDYLGNSTFLFAQCSARMHSKCFGAAAEHTSVLRHRVCGIHCNPASSSFMNRSGKGGVGKTSLAASLAVKLAGEGHQVLVVSTDPAHSLSDSLDQASDPNILFAGSHSLQNTFLNACCSAAPASLPATVAATHLAPAWTPSYKSCRLVPLSQQLSGSPPQDVSGGSPVAVQGTGLPIWGMEIDPEAAQVCQPVTRFTVCAVIIKSDAILK